MKLPKKDVLKAYDKRACEFREALAKARHGSLHVHAYELVLQRTEKLISESVSAEAGDAFMSAIEAAADETNGRTLDTHRKKIKACIRLTAEYRAKVQSL